MLHLLIWNENQRASATWFGLKANSAQYYITVCPTTETMVAARKSDPNAVVYYYGGR